MKQLLCYATILSALIFFTGCDESVTKETVKADSLITEKLLTDSVVPLTDHHNAVSSLDWDGIYKGTVTCADCEGIATEIMLGKDLSYTIKTTYIGKAAKSTEEKGKFGWDVSGSIITLKGIANRPNQYFVGENYLAQMDMSGKQITGGLANKYILTKQQQVMASALADSSNKNATLVETYWKLITLNGQAVEMPAEGKREIYLILKKNDNRVQGFSGCNTMMGLYELKDASLIHFKNLAGTRMACNNMTTENDFKKMLEQVDNYSIDGDNLSLNKAKMAPLATFKAVYLR